MTRSDILTIAKIDLEISGNSRDDYLNNLIDLAESAITTEGINLIETTDDGMLIERYAVFLYRKRREDTMAMPRSLRYLLNNRLMHEKGSVKSGE